jgi:hypothetical protein
MSDDAAGEVDCEASKVSVVPVEGTRTLADRRLLRR